MWAYLQAIWQFLSNRWPDIGLAIVLAVVFAIIADLMRIGSRIREAIRHFKNRLAERSVARLRARIKYLERERSGLAALLASDKGLYLQTLRSILTVLLLASLGGILLAIGPL